MMWALKFAVLVVVCEAGGVLIILWVTAKPATKEKWFRWLRIR